MRYFLDQRLFAIYFVPQFVRRILRHSFQYLANRIWDQNEVDWFNTMFSESIVNANISTAQTKVPVGLQLHLINIYLEELAKVIQMT